MHKAISDDTLDVISCEMRGKDDFTLSGLYKNQYYHMRYMWHSKKEALEMFKNFVLSEDKKIIRAMED
jgi:hypothetical protein